MPLDHDRMMRDMMMAMGGLGGGRPPEGRITSGAKEVGFDRVGKKGWRKRGSTEIMRHGDVYLDPLNDWEPVKGLDGHPVEGRNCWTREALDPSKAPKGVEWEDVIGLEVAKAEMKDAIESPYKNKDLFEAFGMKPPKGVLLYGPPGCGKTMLGKAAATAMAKVHGKSQMDGFFYFNGADMYGPHVGDESKWVRNAFEQGESFYRSNGFPAVLFFDECDSMLPRRDMVPSYAVTGVNTFLSLLDGLKPCSSFVLLATNSHHRLDEAAIREGRIDRKIFVGPPERNAVEAILISAFKGKPLQKGASPESFAAKATAALFHESSLIGDAPMSLHLNGANVAGLANRAAQIAFRMAVTLRESGAAVKDLAWISVDHLEQAIKALRGEILDMVQRAPSKVDKVEIDHKITVQGGPEKEDWE